MSYLGRSAKLSLKAQEKVSFLATAGQTSKTGLSYVPSFVEVYVNGILLTDTTDFTATNGNSVTFTVALALNDEVTVVSLKTFTVADHYTQAQADAAFANKGVAQTFTETQSFNRVGSDGVIVDFEKDGTTVGSIGVVNSSEPYFTSASRGVRISGNNIRPCTTGGANSDDLIILGSTGQRFRDLYLSGGVYLGGVGSSNHLDDYEEGSFTLGISVEGQGSPTFSPATSYVKVGNLVTIQFNTGTISNVPNPSGTRAWEFSGMPFTSKSGLNWPIVVKIFNLPSDANYGYVGSLYGNSTMGRIEMRNARSVINASNWMNGSHAYVQITYRTT